MYDGAEVVGEKRQGLGSTPVLWEESGTPDGAAKLEPLTRKSGDAKATGIGLMRPKSLKKHVSQRSCWLTYLQQMLKQLT